MLNGLHSLAREKDQFVFNQSGYRLIEHLMAHFAHEEAVLIRNGYPLVDAHAIKHKDILDDVKTILEGIVNADPVDGMDSAILEIKFLLLDHLIDDLAYKNFFSEHRLCCPG